MQRRSNTPLRELQMLQRRLLGNRCQATDKTSHMPPTALVHRVVALSRAENDVANFRPTPEVWRETETVCKTCEVTPNFALRPKYHKPNRFEFCRRERNEWRRSLGRSFGQDRTLNVYHIFSAFASETGRPVRSVV